MTQKVSAEDKRYAAIRTLVEGTYPKYDEETYPYVARVTLKRREEIADSILAMLPLGRTDRWKNEVTRWAYMVSESDSTDILRWAVMQGSIYAGFGAGKK